MTVTGVGASPGCCIGPVRVLSAAPPAPLHTVDEPGIPEELHRWNTARERARSELTALCVRAAAAASEILGAQILFLDDPALVTAVSDSIRQGRNAEWAVQETVESLAAELAQLADPYLRERAADVQDIGRRLRAALSGRSAPEIRLTEPSIIAAHDLTPSDTAQMDPSLVLGWITETGGPTSHAVIMARSMGIPAVVGAMGLLKAFSDGDRAVLDATAGRLIINPGEAVEADYSRRIATEAQTLELQHSRKDLPAVTPDGRRVELAVNVGGPKDVPPALEWGAEGVGLLRTEFLYMHRSALPTETEIYEACAAVVRSFAPRPVIIRTLDIGGDKTLPYLQLPREENPFLGYRGLRICLDRPDLFRTQLRALIRTGMHGRLRIMFPMVATLDEIRRAKAALAEAAASLETEGPDHARHVEVGIMIETPAAAVLADILIREVDFFSIGSNDLIQYTMAADRTNAAVHHLYQHLQPGVLRLMDGVIKAAHAAQKWVGVCGEMAGDPEVVPILVGLGLDEFSMAPRSLPKIRDLIRSMRWEDCRIMAESALACGDAAEVRQLVRSRLHAIT